MYISLPRRRRLAYVLRLRSRGIEYRVDIFLKERANAKVGPCVDQGCQIAHFQT
jgi:hypothetical protein